MKQGILYHFLKALVKLAVRVFYRKIYITKAENLNSDSAKILAVNHPTAFLDPIFLATFSPKLMHFQIRGDRFNKPFYRKLLNLLNAVPIYRLRDGFSNVKRGESFNLCYKILKQKGNLIILSEGLTKYEKRLRPIQRGTARIAFGAWEKNGDENLEVIPVGVNYTDSHLFRSEVMIEYGEPIYLKDYLHQYNLNKRPAILNLTADLAIALRKKVVHVKEPKNDELANFLLDIQRNDLERNRFPIVEKDNSPLDAELALVKKLNNLSDDDNKELQRLAKRYKSLLDHFRVDDKGLSKSTEHLKPFHPALLLSGLFLPFAYLLNCLPLYAAKYLADNQVEKIEFHAPVRLVSGLGFYIVYFLLLTVAGFILIGFLPTIVIMVLLVFFGFLTLLTLDLYADWKERMKFRKLDSADQLKLSEARIAVVNFMKK